MIQFRKHIVSQLFVFVLTFVLLLPNVIKIIHSHEHSVHQSHENEDKAHLHEADFDSCDLCKFSFSNYLYTHNDAKLTFYTPEPKEQLVTLYTFIDSHKQLSLSLRGPPSLV